MKTIRRDRLRRLVEAGRVETVETYHYDDMMDEHRTRKPMPVAIKPADWRDRQEGIRYLTDHDFTANSGCAWMNPDGTITLIVHSSSNYTLRISQ
jgi:hypothetical protein